MKKTKQPHWKTEDKFHGDGEYKNSQYCGLMSSTMLTLQIAASNIFKLAEVYESVRCDNPTQGYTTDVEWSASKYPEMQFGEPLCSSCDECPDMGENGSTDVTVEKWQAFKGMSKPMHQSTEKPDGRTSFSNNLFIFQPVISSSKEDGDLMTQKTKEADRFARLQPKFCENQIAACFHAQMIPVLDHLWRLCQTQAEAKPWRKASTTASGKKKPAKEAISIHASEICRVNVAVHGY